MLRISSSPGPSKNSGHTLVTKYLVDLIYSDYADYREDWVGGGAGYSEQVKL